MREYFTDKEISEKLKALTVICDTREQENAHVTGYFTSHKIPFISRKIDAGDYSAQVGNVTFESEVVIEKKNSIDEIAGNFTVDRERFEREFIRAKADGLKIYLLIENCSWAQISAHDYRSKLEPKALTASLLAWQARYNITVNFCEPCETGQIIYGTLYYWVKQKLEKG
jgi:ERCC4-type nuclease